MMLSSRAHTSRIIPADISLQLTSSHCNPVARRSEFIQPFISRRIQVTRVSWEISDSNWYNTAVEKVRANKKWAGFLYAWPIISLEEPRGEYGEEAWRCARDVSIGMLRHMNSWYQQVNTELSGEYEAKCHFVLILTTLTFKWFWHLIVFWRYDLDILDKSQINTLYHR